MEMVNVINKTFLEYKGLKGVKKSKGSQKARWTCSCLGNTTERRLKRKQNSQNSAKRELHPSIRKNNESKMKPSVKPTLTDSSY